MTKKFQWTVSLLALVILITSACLCYMNFYYPPKPKDTNLKYWVGQNISKEEREALGFTELARPGLIGGGTYYLDGDYEAILETSPEYCRGEVPYKTEPDVYVSYCFNNYPDLMTQQRRLTGISFNDPKYYLYGLNINSTREEVDAKLLSLGFEIDYFVTSCRVYDQDAREWKKETTYIHTGNYRKDNICIHFEKDYMSVGLASTNYMGIVY